MALIKVYFTELELDNLRKEVVRLVDEIRKAEDELKEIVASAKKDLKSKKCQLLAINNDVLRGYYQKVIDDQQQLNFTKESIEDVYNRSSDEKIEDYKKLEGLEYNKNFLQELREDLKANFDLKDLEEPEDESEAA